MATAIPGNSAAFTRDEVVSATNATAFGSSTRAGCVGVTTDSRGDVEGKLFVALCGDNFDGHRYVEDVLARGAYGVIVEQDGPPQHPGLAFRVASTLDALGSLARLHRLRWGGKVVTIGGSAGKTTTRSAVQTFLSVLVPDRVYGTVGNLNNLVGVPMTLLGLTPAYDYAVVEIGTNQRGEVERLSAICVANVALLTCVGLEHSEGLGDLDGIEEEERAMFSHLAAGATAIGWFDDERVLRQVNAAHVASRWTYGQLSGATHRIVSRRSIDRERSELVVARPSLAPTELTLVTRLCGLPGALASTAAVAVADALGIALEPAKARDALDRQVGEAGRLRILERSDRALVIDDCYNANPVSMRSSFAVAKELAQAEERRLVFVLGDMRELGELSEREHRALASELDGVTEVVAVGKEMAVFAESARRLGHSVQYFADSEAAQASVSRFVHSGDVVLVKGSRGIRLERVVSAISEGEGSAS
jgi:UDP-N-acetylmuramoyl-tripeptide--D-alanyl-D-alanine ligase